ncbi:hypothetical protein GGR56DRAFT_635058 [Xylariaceae sp. FL0804]|nr:hypothetical protein GGR56DRAFT_635058 [Xylariaceae sp. FL0804]
MTLTKFPTQLDGSSYHAPGGGELYKPSRQKMVSQAIASGYDQATMTEHGVTWADDQDPFGHVMNAGFPHYVTTCNFRLFESFEEQLKDKFRDFIGARGIGIVIKTTILDIKNPVSYPDSIIVATRIDEVKPDRYHVITTLWSLRQEICVAESKAWVVFYDYSRKKTADLIQAGGVYTDLYKALVEKAAIANRRRAEWTARNAEKLESARL